jgi:carbamoyl-phosphate synthase large subunit
MKNILITSIGRRVELINLFKIAINEKKLDCKILGIDNSNTAPGKKFVDIFETISRVDSPTYLEELLSLIKRYNIGLIIPTIDSELAILSKIKSDLQDSHGCLVLIPDYDVLSHFRNKINAHDFFMSKGFKTPILYEPKNVNNFPVFIKPYDGSSSIGANKVLNLFELNYFIKKTKNPMIQEFIEGSEYSVDVFKYFNNEIVSMVIRERIVVRAGEISKGKIIRDLIIEKEILRFSQSIKFIGNITIQVIRNQNNIYFIEVNCRFGGGTPISIMAGANSCHYAIDMMIGKPLIKLPLIKTNIHFSRYDQTVFL